MDDLRGQLHLLERGITSLKESAREQASYNGVAMRHLVEIRADATYARTLGEYMAAKLAPFLKDPGLIVELEELKREREKNLEDLAMPPRRPSYSDLSPTGQQRAITEAELKLTMAIDRVRELEDDRAERDKAQAAELAKLQKQLDDTEARRKFWSRTIIGVVASVVAGVVIWQVTVTLASHEKSTVVETKEKQR